MVNGISDQYKRICSKTWLGVYLTTSFLLIRNKIHKSVTLRRIKHTIVYFMKLCFNEGNIVRYASQLTLGFACVSLYLIILSRKETVKANSIDIVLVSQIENTRIRLRTILDINKSVISKSQNEHDRKELSECNEINPIDVQPILDVINELFSLNGKDELIHESLLVCTRSVVHNLSLIDGLGQCELSAETCQEVIKQLDNAQDILSTAKQLHVSVHIYTREMAKVVNVAKAAVYTRKRSQLSKAMLLFSGAKSQVPYLVASSVLKVLGGYLFALKAHFMSKFVSLAYSHLSGSHVIDTTQKPKKTITGLASIFRNLKLLLTLEVLVLLNNFVTQRFRELGQMNFVTTLETQLFRSLLKQDLSFFETNEPLEVRQLVSTTAHTCETIFNFPIEIVDNVSTLIASVVLLLSKSKYLSVLLMVLLPLRLSISFVLDEMEVFLDSILYTHYPREALRDLWSLLAEPIGIRTMRCFGREQLEVVCAFYSF